MPPQYFCKKATKYGLGADDVPTSLRQRSSAARRARELQQSLGVRACKVPGEDRPAMGQQVLGAQRVGDGSAAHLRLDVAQCLAALLFLRGDGALG